jgi:formyl-CoA transferase
LTEKLLFADLKVLDVGSWIAAPVATTMLADYGAQVIKIEAPDLGDGYRNFADMPGTPDADTNYTWHMDNRNKRSLGLNLKSEAGRKILRQLVAECDVYVTNLPQPMRRQWQLTYEDLVAVNTSMIYASLTAYGEQGPERDREGFDLVAYWSRSGLMDLVHAPGAPPGPALPGMGDHPTAVTLYAGIVTALLKRAQTGQGSHVHTSLMANGVWSASCIAQGVFADADFGNYFANQSRQFTRLLYEASDRRWLQFSMVRTDDEVDALFVGVDRPDLLVDERFATSEARLEHGEALKTELAAGIAHRSSSEWMQVFAESGVPAALVGQVADLANDQQVSANAMAVAGPPGSQMNRMIMHPMNIDGLITRVHAPAPDQGQHNDEVLHELGYSPEHIAKLREEGVI